MKTLLASASLLFVAGLASSEPTSGPSRFCESATWFKEWGSPYRQRTYLAFVAKDAGYEKGWTMALTYNQPINGHILVGDGIGPGLRFGDSWGKDCEDTACPDGVVGSCVKCTFKVCHGFCPYPVLRKGTRIQIPIEITYSNPRKPGDAQVVSAVINNDGNDLCKK